MGVAVGVGVNVGVAGNDGTTVAVGVKKGVGVSGAGGTTFTCRVATLLAPLGASLEVIAVVLLGQEPCVMPWTFTVIVQFPLAAIAPPVSVTVAAAATAATVPPQVFETPGVAATRMPAEKLSVVATLSRR